MKKASKLQIPKCNSKKVKSIPDLLEWLQDMNWPIAQDMEDLIADYEEYLVPHIRAVFKTSDGSWKYFLLHGLINRLSNIDLH